MWSATFTSFICFQVIKTINITFVLGTDKPGCTLRAETFDAKHSCSLCSSVNP